MLHANGIDDPVDELQSADIVETIGQVRFPLARAPGVPRNGVLESQASRPWAFVDSVSCRAVFL